MDTRAVSPRAPDGYRGPVPIDLTAESTKRVGLVLGGGGIAGMAFHAGVLLALHHDLGWDARDADVIVGTSAGSIVGALLRARCDTRGPCGVGHRRNTDPGRSQVPCPDASR